MAKKTGTAVKLDLAHFKKLKDYEAVSRHFG